MAKDRSLMIAIIGIVIMSIIVTLIFAFSNARNSNSVVGAAVSVCAQYAADRNYWCVGSFWSDPISWILKHSGGGSYDMYTHNCASAEAGLMNPANHCLPSNAPLN